MNLTGNTKEKNYVQENRNNEQEAHEWYVIQKAQYVSIGRQNIF